MNPKTPLDHEILNMLLGELGNVNQSAIRNLMVRIAELVERERADAKRSKGGRPPKVEIQS